MEKDYYTKEEVDKLLSDLKNEILAKKQDKSSLKKHKTILISDINILDYNNLTRFHVIQFLDFLKKQLEEKKLIKHTSSKIFLEAFRNNEIKTVEEPIIKWIGKKNLCIYFLEELKELFNLDERYLNKKANLVFGIKNSKELKRNYQCNSTNLPRNHKIIDDIIEKCRDWSINISENISKDDIYFRKHILPEIENDID